MMRILPLQIVGRITALALAALVAAPASAHEIRLIPTKRAEERSRVLPIMVPGQHLALSSPSLDFGDVLVGQSTQSALVIDNVTADDTLSIDLSGGGEVSLSTTSLTLAPGQSATVTLTYTPTSSGTLSQQLTLTSYHSGAAAGVADAVDLTGSAISPARLELRDPVTGQLLSDIDFGAVTINTNPPPFIDVKFVNAGQAQMPSQITVTGFFNIVGGNPHGNCSMVTGNYFCVGTPGFAPTFLLRSELEDLPGGASFISRVWLFPHVTEMFGPGLTISYNDGLSHQELQVPVLADVVPYLLDDPLFGAGSASGAIAHKASGGGDFVLDVMAPRLARGRGIDKVFADVADLDDINLMNGNLTMAIAMGQSHPVGGDLTYQLQLAYNSNVWDRWMQVEDLQLFTPQAGANAGVGWTLHLGRLCEPFDRDDFRNLSREERDKVFCRTDEFKYYSPTGSVHTFERYLHTDLDSVNLSGNLENVSNLYTQDGSYIRMKRVSATIRDLEFPGGTVHRFERKSLAAWGDALPDLWRITQIKDRNNNVVTVQHEARTDGTVGIQLKLTDGHRTSYIKFKRTATGYYPYLVDKVDLAVFGGDPAVGGNRAVYGFTYQNKTVTRLSEGSPSPPGSVTAPVLTTLTLPDTSTYVFDYYTTGGSSTGRNTLRAKSVDLPTGGRIEWEYSYYKQPSAEACVNNDDSLSSVFFFAGVGRRTLKDENGNRLDEKRFYQGLDSGDSVPSDYCDRFPQGPGAELPADVPEAVSVTTVVEPTRYDAASNATENAVTQYYFSVFPISVNPARNGNPATPSAGGWTGLEFGMPFNRNVIYDPGAPAEDREYLSTRTYSCGVVSSVPVLSNCALLRSHYVRFGRSPSFGADDFTYSPANPRKRRGRDVFHDDAGRWLLTTFREFDGLGHFRYSDRTANFGGSRLQTSFTNYNDAAGELIADGNGITQNITVPSVWALNTFNRFWVQGSIWTGTSNQLIQRRGGERCWTAQANRLTLDRERTWTGAGRGANDFITRSTYTNGNRTREEYFGGDVRTVPNTSTWCTAALGTAQYQIDHTYQGGALQSSKFLGASFFALDRTIDTNTGLTATERDSGGVGTEFTYDPMGRVTEEKHAVDATRTFTYELPGVHAVNTPKIAVREHTRNQPSDELTISSVAFDAAGRVFEETERQPNGTNSKRWFTYTPRSLIESATTWQRAALFDAGWTTDYLYDALGRPTSVTEPDDSDQTMTYIGARQSNLTRKVGTTHSGGTVSETSFTISRILDPFGRVESIVAPEYTNTMGYDSLGQVSSSTRTAGAKSQTRTFARNGRRLLTSETHPEKSGAVTYSDYDAMGNPGKKVNGPDTLRFSYDSAGRLELVEEKNGSSWEVLQRYTYYTSGTGNGRQHTTLRHHYLTAANTGNLAGVAGTWSVNEVYFYGADGRVSGRNTSLVNNDGEAIGNFSQSWTHSPLGRVESLSYPSICNSTFTSCTDVGRTVTNGYTRGKLTSVTATNSLGATLSYHPNGLLASVAHGNGKTDTFGLDAKNIQRLASISLANGSLNLGTYQYDSSGNITNLGNQRYTYDGLGRLKEHFDGSSRVDWYGYDGFDNLTRVNGSAQGISSTTNRLNGQSYDSAGNQTSDDCADLNFDPLGLLRTYTEVPLGVTCPGTTHTWLSLYTAGDKRLLVGGTAIGFHWTVRDLNGKVLSTFKQSGPGLSRVKDYVYRSGALLATRSNGTTRHLHLDHLDSPRAISTGGNVDQREFSPYGVLLDPSFGEDFQFAGHERDENGETIHMLARTYDSSRGRFFSTDPETSTWNLYSYAENNPLAFADPDGREVVPVAKIKPAIGFNLFNIGAANLSVEELSHKRSKSGSVALNKAEVELAIGVSLKFEFQWETISFQDGRQMVIPRGASGFGSLKDTRLGLGPVSISIQQGADVLKTLEVNIPVKASFLLAEIGVEGKFNRFSARKIVRALGEIFGIGPYAPYKSVVEGIGPDEIVVTPGDPSHPAMALETLRFLCYDSVNLNCGANGFQQFD